MPTFPATRRAFLDAEVRNESAAVAGLLRGLAQWQNTTYARDLRVTPSDAAVYVVPGAWTYGVSGPTDVPNTPSVYRSSGASGNLAEIFLPDPLGPYRRIAFRVYCTLDSSTATGRVDFYNAATEATTSLSITYAALGSSLTGWLPVTVDAAALQTIRVSSIHLGGTGFRTDGISGYWAPPTVSGLTQVAMAPTGPAAAELARNDGPYSSLLLRHLTRTANALWYYRPPQVISKWWWGYGSGTSADWSSFPRCVGRYWVYVGAYSTTLSMRIGTSSGVTGSLNLSINGSTNYVTVPLSGSANIVGTVSVPVSETGGPVEVTITIDGNPPYIEVWGVMIHESAATLPASAPTDYAIVDDAAIASSSKIVTSLASMMVSNMMWLWAYRRMRVLISDCRLTPSATWTHQAWHSIPLSRPGISTDTQTAPIRVRQGHHLVDPYGPGWLPTWKADGGTKTYAVAGEDAWAPVVNAPNVTVKASESWDPHAQLHWQHRQGALYTAGSVATFQTDRATVDGVDPRQSWTILEEMPIGTPFLIGAP